VETQGRAALLLLSLSRDPFGQLLLIFTHSFWRRAKKEEAVEFVKLLDGAAEFAGNLPTVNLSPDPKDNFILAMAIAGRADLLVSGDKKHVHALKRVGDTVIVSPTKAVQRLQENDTTKKTTPSTPPDPQGPR